MSKRLAVIAALAAAAAVPAGVRASQPNSTLNGCKPPSFIFSCFVSLTATGPSPSMLTMPAGHFLGFDNTDSADHTVVFANGLCMFTLAPGTHGDVGSEPSGCGGSYPALPFPSFAGTYAYMVDGKYPGTVVTTPWARSVSLRARTQTVRAGTLLPLHGEVLRSNTGTAPPPPVVVLARRSDEQHFKRVATVRTRGSHQAAYAWKLGVRPEVATVYIAEVTAQRLCYYPASRCAHPQGQVWANARSRPFTVRIRH